MKEPSERSCGRPDPMELCSFRSTSLEASSRQARPISPVPPPLEATAISAAVTIVSSSVTLPRNSNAARSFSASEARIVSRFPNPQVGRKRVSYRWLAVNYPPPWRRSGAFFRAVASRRDASHSVWGSQPVRPAIVNHEPRGRWRGATIVAILMSAAKVVRDVVHKVSCNPPESQFFRKYRGIG